MQREKIANGVFMQWHNLESVSLVVEKEGRETTQRFTGETAMQDAERAGMDIAMQQAHGSSDLFSVTKPLVP